MSKLVSAIVTTHNRADLVGRAVQSVLAQTYPALECLVVDDGSSDHTPAVLERLAATAPQLRVLRHERRQGLSAARNTGIAQAAGDYVAFLDDDDHWLARKIEKQAACLETSPPEIGLVYCWFEYRAHGAVLGRRCPTLSGQVFGQLLERQPLGNGSTLMVTRAAAAAVGGFDVDLPRGIDGDFIRRLALRYEIRCVPEILVHVDVGHGFPRITEYDRAGVLNALAADHAKLRKFARELERYPRQRAAIYSTIGFHHSLLGEWREAQAWFWRAVRGQPLHPGAYLPLLRAGKALLLRTARGRSRPA